ncbi:hypothetical protein F8M41_017199 [Gigaspora margarita]|uniref:F-box domain-containing protein n=1 Tax=Gigaspora margarita TaxID=4874 RepID=A0A8H4B2Y4_GIGMA|nr:hypothetical protein F8M41_017199 [Gigaspora margarita]
MSSKIFMGDMPELMNNILNSLNNDFYSLYSCALVSRHWCKMSIPILWQDPFSFERKPLFISKYFSSLGEEEKYVLKKCGINAEFTKTLFDYARFLKVLDLSRLESKVKKWIDIKLVNSKLYYNISIYHTIILLIKLLFKLFIESGAALHKLDLHFSEFLEFTPEIFYSLGENKQFFSRLQDIYLYLHLDTKSYEDKYIENANALTRILAKNATKISTLELDGVYSKYKPRLLFNSFMHIIKSQEQLRRFKLNGKIFSKEFYGIISALECQKNSLQEIIIENCSFSAEFKVLKNCKNLEILRIRNCNDAKLLKVLNYKVSTLEIINCSIDASTIVQILEESGILLQSILLQRLKFKSEDTEIWEESLLEALKSFCPNITYLNISRIGFSTQLLELIGNLQKLQFLTLQCIINIPEEEIKIRVMRFAEILPLTLHYFDLRDYWLTPYIDILLNHCNAPLKKMLIFLLYNEKNAKALIKFCIRKRTLNYVGVDYLILDDYIRKDIESYVTLVPCESWGV